MNNLENTEARGAGVLAVWTDAKPENEPDFNDWYNRDHLPERTGHPGFLNGRRYKAISGSPRYLALYDTTSPDALSHPDYRYALENPSDWTQRIMPAFQNFTRSVLRVDCRYGTGQGGVVTTIRPQNDQQAPPDFGQWLRDDALPDLMKCEGVVSAEYLSVAPGFAVTDANGTTEGALRTTPDSVAPWAIIVAATEPGLLRDAWASAVPRKTIRAHAQAGLKIGTYRLLYAL
ncbi:MAG: hypothetical protein ACJAU6_002376 [Alphaproteobacteria bacterium]|jgi:hypothetical protein